jgi:general secretion pathway protein D
MVTAGGWRLFPTGLLIALGVAVLPVVAGCSSSPEPRHTRRLAAAKRATLEQPTVPDEGAGAEAEPGAGQEETAPEAPAGALAAREEPAGKAAEEPAASEEPAAEEPADKTADASPGEEEPKEPEAEPTPPKAERAAARAGGKMTPEKLIRLMGLSNEARQREAAELVRQARAHRTNLDTALAEEALDEAVALDPQNEEARRLRAEVQTLRGSRVGTIRQVTDEISNQHRIALMQGRAEVRNAINSGDRHSEQKDFDAAIRDYEKAIQMARGFPYNLNLDEEVRSAEARLKKAGEDKRNQAEEGRRDLAKRMSETRQAELESTTDLIGNRIRELRRTARDAWEREDYALVEDISSQILSVYPDDPDANELLRDAREERHLQTQHKIVLNQVENHQRVLLGLDESAITYQKLFRYPPAREWKRIQPKVVTIEERVLAEESVVEKEIQRKLDEPQTIGFTEKTPLWDALKVLSTISGLSFNLTVEAQKAVDQDSIQVQLPQMKDTRLSSILNLLLEDKFRYSIENGAVVIGTKDDLKPKYYTEFYDINDVTQTHPDYPAPPLALQELAGQGQAGAGAGAGLNIGAAEEDENRGPVLELTKLIELITKELKDKNDELVGAEPKVQNGKLMVKTTIQNHQRVRALLEQLRKATGIMVTVESRFLDIQENFLEEIGVDMGNSSNTFLPNSIPDIDGAGTSIDPGYEYTNVEQDFNYRQATIGGFSKPLGSRVNPFNVSSAGGGAYQLNIFDAEKFQLEAILVGVGKEQSIRKLNSPRVTAFNTQVSHTLVINQAAYIQDLEVNQTGVIPVINPVIGVLNSGSILEVRPTVSYDRKYVVLEIQPTLAEKLQSERAVLNLSGSFTVVPVELPVLSVTKIKTTVTIPDGGTVLVGGLKREIHNESSIGVPIISRIPILNLLFGRMGESTLRSNLFVLINAKITVVQEEEERLFNT